MADKKADTKTDTKKTDEATKAAAAKVANQSKGHGDAKDTKHGFTFAPGTKFKMGEQDIILTAPSMIHFAEAHNEGWIAGVLAHVNQLELNRGGLKGNYNGFGAPINPDPENSTEGEKMGDGTEKNTDSAADIKAAADAKADSDRPGELDAKTNTATPRLDDPNANPNDGNWVNNPHNLPKPSNAENK